MRIIGHGIDAVKIADIKAEVDSTNKRWTEQFCSADERAHAGTAPTRYRYYASCFAGKEAVVKGARDRLRGRHHLARASRSFGGTAERRYVRLSDEVLELATEHGDYRLVHQHQLSRRDRDGERDRGGE